MIQGREEHYKLSISHSADRVFGTLVVNDQEAGDHKEDEPNGSAAERGDNDSEAESSSEVHGNDHEQGLLSNDLNVIPMSSCHMAGNFRGRKPL